MASNTDTDESTWVKFWILNELIETPSAARRIVENPHESWNSRWQFPGAFALRSSRELRCRSLNGLVAEGDIALYDLESTIPPTEGRGEFEPQHDYWATITKKGFRTWEAFFAPNWNRYWRIENETFDESGRVLTIEFLSASSEMLDCVLRCYPVVNSSVIGSIEISSRRRVDYAIPVGAWKTLEFAVALEVSVIEHQVPLHERDIDWQRVSAAKDELYRISTRWACKGGGPGACWESCFPVRYE